MREELIGIMIVSFVVDNLFKEIWKIEVVFLYRYPGKDQTGLLPTIKVSGSLNPGFPSYNTTHYVHKCQLTLSASLYGNWSSEKECEKY